MKKQSGLVWIVLYTIVLMALLWMAVEFKSGFLGALAAIVIGLGAIWFGIDIVKKREDQSSDEDSDFVSTRRGTSAVLSGIGTALMGLIAVVGGAAYLTGTLKPLFGFIKDHGWTFAGLGGVFLAFLGLMRMLGDEESKGKFDLNWIRRQLDRIIGLPILLFGVALAIAGFTGYVPFIGWIR